MPTVLHQALLIAAKDTRIFFKDRFAVGFSFLFPFLFVIGFTLALSGQGPDDSPLTITVSSQEETEAGETLMAGMIAESPLTIRQLDYDEALAQVESGDLDGFVSFPVGFTQALTEGRPATLEVVTGGGSAESAAALRSFADHVAGELAAVQNTYSALSLLGEAGQADLDAIDWSAALGSRDYAIRFEVETVGEVGPFNASNFTLPGYLTMFVFFAAAMSAEAIARERQTNTLERLMSNGTRREAIVLGKFIGASYRGVAQLAVMWTVGIVAFDIDLGASPAAVIVISALMVLASSAFGLLLASLVSSVRAAATAGVLASLTLAPLGGCWWPLFITPQWMQSLAKITPHGWANTGFNKLMLFGAEFGDVTQEMAALLLFGVAFLAFALWRFRLTAS